MAEGAKAEYGIDAPGVIRNLALVGVAVAVLCLLVHQFTLGPVTFVLYPNLFWTAGSFLLGAVLMLAYSKVGKFRHRDRMLAQIPWTGGERVLDVGTGRGLLLIGAAKKLTNGKATGLDIWNQEDLSGNNLQNLERNIEIEGVGAKTEVVNEDVQKMTFPDATFDAVVSLACLHNIYNAPGRAEACRQIARVLKPGGVAVISDFRNIGEYVAAFRAAGLEVQKLSLGFATFPPMRIIKAQKLRG
ncbi:MAG TPA: class I SAM-dependent methyltransferase [Candidatus Acidoferrales bacterium]